MNHIHIHSIKGQFCGPLASLSYLVAFLVAGNHPHGFNEGVAGVIHPSLYALVQGPVIGGDFVPQSGVYGWGEVRGHAVVVFAEVRKVSTVRKQSLFKTVNKKMYLKNHLHIIESAGLITDCLKD